MKLRPILCLIAVTLFFICTTSMAYSLTDLSSYSYCKTHQITGSPDGALTDYQVRLVIHGGNGTDSGGNVYLNGHAQSWPNDIRFTNAAGGPLDYWVESYDANAATVWVKVDSIPANPGTTTIKLYYGKPGEGSASDGNATFSFFDHFTGPGMDASKWQQLSGSAGGTIVAHSIAAISDPSKTWDQWRSLGTFDKPYAVEALVKASQDSDAWIVGNCISTGGPDMFVGVYWNRSQYASGKTIVDRYSDFTRWTRISMMASDSGSVFLENGTTKATIDTATPDGQYIELAAIQQKTLYVDWIAVRKYTADEPENGAWAPSDARDLTGQPTQGMGKAETPARGQLQPSDYSDVKSGTILGSPDGELSDYQVRFVIHRGTGMDSGEDVYLNGMSQSWPNDIRFTDGDDNLLSYWIEPCNASAATAWVKIDDIPASPGNAIVKLYYGRAGDPGISNGDATFDFFDDFNGNSVDNTKWCSPTDTTKVEESNGVLKVTAGSVSPGEIFSRKTYTNGVIEARVTVSHSSDNCDHIEILARDNGSSEVQCAARGYPKDDFYLFDNGVFRAGPVSYEDLTAHIGDWHKFTFTLNGRSISGHVVNEASGDSQTVSGVTPVIGAGGIGIGAHMKGDTVEADYIFLRKYTADEPRHGAWSGVTTGGTTTQPGSAGPSTPSGSGLSTTGIAIILGACILMVLIFVLIIILGVLVFSASRHK